MCENSCSRAVADDAVRIDADAVSVFRHKMTGGLSIIDMLTSHRISSWMMKTSTLIG